MDEFITWDVPKYMIVGEHELLLEVQKELTTWFEGVLNVFFGTVFFGSGSVWD